MTDSSRCLVICGREFSFPIDFSASTAVCLTSDKKWLKSYAAQQAELLSSARAVAKLVIEEVRAYHRERMNALRPDPRLYRVGDSVFVRRKVQSDKAKGRVDKAEFQYTGPWRVTKKLDGCSYEVQHEIRKVLSKQHASNLTPVPTELIPFVPVNGLAT